LIIQEVLHRLMIADLQITSGEKDLQKIKQHIKKVPQSFHNAKDATIVSLADAYGIYAIATNDLDFISIPGLHIFKPETDKEESTS